jgi:hypothetical protein
MANDYEWEPVMRNLWIMFLALIFGAYFFSQYLKASQDAAFGKEVGVQKVMAIRQ